MKNKFVTVALLCLLIMPTQLFAAESKIIHLNAIVRNDVHECRYQINSKNPSAWIHLDLNEHLIKLVTTDKTKDNIYYQYTLDGKSWSDIIRISFNSNTGNWEYYQEKVAEIAKESETIIAKLDTKEDTNKSNTTLSVGVTYVTPRLNTASSLYTHGYGANVRVDNINNILDIYNELSYWYGESNNNLIDSIHTALLGIGLGYKINLGLLSITPEIGGGLLVEAPIHSVNGALYFFDAYGEGGINMSANVDEETQIYVRADALIFSGSDNEISMETVLTAGTSILL